MIKIMGLPQIPISESVGSATLLAYMAKKTADVINGKCLETGN